MSADLRAAAGGRVARSRPSVLPRLLLLTDRRQARRPLPALVEEAVEAGVRAVVLREKDLPAPERSDLVSALAPILHAAGGLLLTAGEQLPEADGVHLPSAISTHSERLPDSPAGAPDGAAVPSSVGSAAVVGRSCHDRAEVRHAASAGVDYVTLSPVFASASKPGYGPALGEDGLAKLVAAAAVPVFALGGVEDADDVAACRRAGAHGVAVMGALMRAADPAKLAAELVAASEELR